MAQVYSKREDGMSDIDYVKTLRVRESKAVVRPTLIVGTFGISSEGKDITMNWVVSHRRDRRHGAIDEVAPMSYYSKMMLNDMFRGWNE